MKRRRDELLDLWRGLALVDMAWVHLGHAAIGLSVVVQLWITEWGRFAAGTFVLLSGLTVARVFGPQLGGPPEVAAAARRWFLRRALLLLFLDRFVSFGTSSLHAARRWQAGEVIPDLGAILRFEDPGATGGLLLLYAILLVLTPGMDFLRRRVGWGLPLAASLGLYAAAQVGGPIFRWPPWTFPVAFWQPLFVIGFLGAPLLDRVRDAENRWRAAPVMAVALAFATIFAVRNGGAFGWFDPSLSAPLGFVKYPLRPGELLWYLLASLFVMSISGWACGRWPALRRGTGWLTLLGRNGLLIYVVHLFLEVPIGGFLEGAGLGPSAALAGLVLMAALMTGVAWLAERVEKPAAWLPEAWDVLRWLRLPPSGALGGAVATATLAVVLALGPTSPPASMESGILASEIVEDWRELVAGFSWEFPMTSEEGLVGYEESELEIEAIDVEATIDAFPEEPVEL